MVKENETPFQHSHGVESLLKWANWKPAGWSVCCWSCRWLVLDTDSKDLVTMHTDGNEQLSVLKYGPGNEWRSFCYSKQNSSMFDTSNITSQTVISCCSFFLIQMVTSWPSVPTTTTSTSTLCQKMGGSTAELGNARWAPVFVADPHVWLAYF